MGVRGPKRQSGHDAELDSRRLEQMTYRDRWEEDSDGHKFVFTVAMQRRLAEAGLPTEPEYLGELGVEAKPAKAEAEKPAVERSPEVPDVIQIDPATGGEDIFFHKTSAIGDPAEIAEGQWVLYDVEERSKGPEATEVEPYTAEQEE
jgi:cold shock CspA family protein